MCPSTCSKCGPLVASGLIVSWRHRTSASSACTTCFMPRSPPCPKYPSCKWTLYEAILKSRLRRRRVVDDDSAVPAPGTPSRAYLRASSSAGSGESPANSTPSIQMCYGVIHRNRRLEEQKGVRSGKSYAGRGASFAGREIAAAAEDIHFTHGQHRCDGDGGWISPGAKELYTGADQGQILSGDDERAEHTGSSGRATVPAPDGDATSTARVRPRGL